MKHTTSELFERLDRICTDQMRSSSGYGVHCICGHYSNQEIFITRLRNLLQPEDDSPLTADNSCLLDDEFMAILNNRPDLPVKAFDRKTLMAVSRRFTTLRNLERRYKANHDLGRLEQIRNEIDILNGYLANKLPGESINAQIKSIARQDYEAIYAAVHRFWKQVRKRDEELYWLLKAHLKIGYYCIWYDDNPPTPMYLP